MNDETPTKMEKTSAQRRTGLRRRLPEPVEAAGFAVQERVIWPLQDRFSLLPGRSLALIGGGAAALLAAVVVAVLVLSSGGGSSAPTRAVSEAAAPRQPLVSPASTQQPKPRKAAQRETLHGAAPVFSPPSPASKGGEKSGKSNSQAAESEAPEEEAPAETASASEPASSSPAGATISSDPEQSSKTAEGATAGSAARAAVPDGPPAGPAALAVAREFAKGFVVYETGGADSAAFRDAFEASATPELAKALLQRPPKQPAGVKVPRAKVLNVVAGPSQGTVYTVSVSLLRVGVTSELRLDMERIKTAGKSGKRAEWRVTNVLG